MCDPTTMTALQVGSAVVGLQAKQQQSNAVAKSAKDAYFIKSKQSNLRLLQEQNKASEIKQDANLKALKAQGTAIAVAGGSGVQGRNVEQLIKDFERSEGVMTARVESQLKGMQAQNEMDKLAFQSEAQSRINSNPPPSFAESLFAVAEPLANYKLDLGEKNAQRAFDTGVG